MIYYPYMPERLYQLRLDNHFNPDIPKDVTPKGFAGFEFDAEHWLRESHNHIAAWTR